MDTKFTIFIVFVFIAAFFALEAFYYWWARHYGAESTRLKKRIEHITSHDLDRSAYHGILKNRYVESKNPFYRFLFNLSLTKKLDALLLHSGELWTIPKFFKLAAVCASIAVVIGLILNFNLAVVVMVALLATL